jgi:hypothetical protein
MLPPSSFYQNHKESLINLVIRNFKLMNIQKFLMILLLFTSSMALNAQEISFMMEVTPDKSKETIKMKVFAKGSKIAVIPQNLGQGNMKIIVDNAAGKQYMLMDMNGEKMAMSLSSKATAAAESVQKEPKLTMTNDKKVIDGYNCTRMVAETDDNISDLWLSENVGITYAELFKMMNTSKAPGMKGSASLPEMKNIKGFPLEMTSRDKKNGEIVTMRIRDIVKGNINDNTFSLDGYKMMEMGNTNH